MEARSSGGVRASKELCFYCFDAILSQLEQRNCAPPDFTDGKCAVCISWAKCNLKKGDELPDNKAKYTFEARGSLINMVPMRLHSEEFLRTIRDSAFGDPRRPSIMPEDIQYLRCSVSLILEDTYKTLTDLEDWEIGKHGVRIEFQHGGKNRNKVYPPETILARGWTKRETVEEGIAKAGYDGVITAEFLRSVRLTRFETSTCIVSFKEYLKHVEDVEKQRKRKQQSPSSATSNRSTTATTTTTSLQEEKQNTLIRRRKRYLRSWLKKVHPDKASSTGIDGNNQNGNGQDSNNNNSSATFNSWALLLGVAIVFAAIFFLRFHEATYDADYEAFQSNYDLLGVDRGAPIAAVRKAFKMLSLKWHPDKNPGCSECADMYVKITDAYKQLSDYDKGTLRLVNKPGSSNSNARAAQGGKPSSTSR